MIVHRLCAACRLLSVAMACGLFAGGVSAQTGLRVEIEAPDSVKPLLVRHLRILNRSEQALPEAPADRAALARRTRREAAELLATEGYFSPDIQLQREPDGVWRLVVEPGRQARVTEISLSFEGDLAGDEAERAAHREALRDAWTLKPGEPFVQAAWDGAKQSLLDRASARLYAAARLASSRAEVDPDAAAVRLSVTLDSGPRFFLGPLEVRGLQDLPSDIVERFSRLEPGDPFDQERMLALQSTLQNVPQFASVIVEIDRDPSHAAAVPVRVLVTEAQSRQLGFGAGFSTNNGYRAETSWRDVNLFGKAWELSSGLRLEQRRQSAYADVFFLPTAANYRYSVGGAAERSDVEGLTVETRAVGLARARSRANIDTRIELRLQHERRSPDGAQTTRQNALTANWAWTRRRVDDLLDPRSGNVLKLELGGGADLLLSDRTFVRAYARYTHYQPVRQGDVLILRAEAGATIADSRDGVPQDFLFRAGGGDSVRGYDFQSLGAREGEAVVGGRYLGTLSAEYVHWFRPRWGVAAFVDAGDAADSRDGLDFRLGYGLGARWKSPAGPLALDLAYGQADRRLQLHFGVAIAF